jgi:hypothetical protein
MKVFRNFVGLCIDYVMYRVSICIIIFDSILVFLFVIIFIIVCLGLLMEGIFYVYLMDNIMDKTYVSCNLDIISITDMSDITDTTDISDYIDYIKFVEDIDTDVK